MNPLKSHNIVAKILQVYAYVNGVAGIILALLLIEDWGALVAAIVFAIVLVVNFFIFALGEIIGLLQNIKENTRKKVDISDELPDL